MKRNILLFLISLIFCSANADGGINIGYCGGAVSKKGCVPVKGEGWIHAAAVLTPELLTSYAGTEMNSIRVGLASRLNIDTLKVWVRNTIDGTDLATGMAVFGEGQSIIRGWNEISLDNNIKIDGTDAISIGYSFHHKKDADVISAVGSPVENSFYINKGEEWEDMSSLGTLSIEAVVTGGSFASYDLALKDVYGMSSSNGGINFTAMVENKGTTNVSGFEITTSVEGYDDVFVRHFDIEVPSSGVIEVRYNEAIPAELEAGTQRKIIARITSIDGGDDENTDNNEANVRYSYKKYVLVEEFTGERCGNCPRAAQALHELITDENYAGKIIPVTHHSGFYEDWLTTEADTEYTWFYNSNGTFAPAMMYDRYAFFLSDGTKGNPTPVGLVPDKDFIKEHIDKRLESFSHVTFDMTGEYDNKVTVTIKIKGERDKRFSKTDERITVFLLEDNIKAKQQNGAGDDYMHNYVLRAWNSIWGSVIEWNENTFEYECQLILDPYWIKKNLHVTAFVSSYDPENPAECSVENARDIRFDTITGIEDIESDSNIVRTDYYTTDGLKINTLRSGLYIQRDIYADGREEVKKIIR